MTLIAFDHGTHKIGVASGNAITGTAPPLNMDGSESESSQRARKFARRLHGRFGIRVWMIDERLSTREARERTGTRRADSKVDSMAAAVIAEGYLGGATPVAP